MDEPWKLTVWGVRGSFPNPHADFLEYGGNTSCLSLNCGDTLVVLDAGSGMVPLGRQVLREKRRRVDILLSHLHLDHVIGLFPFAPLHDSSVEVHLYGTPEMIRALVRLVGPPLWPVGLSDCRAKVRFHAFRPGDRFPLDAVSVTTLEGSHPGGCVYYRLEGQGRSLVYALDCELEEDTASRLTAFARGTDLLIWDANYTSADLKRGWGHSTWAQGLELGQAAGAKQVLMTHYSSGCRDEFLREQEALAASPLSRFAKEGMVLEL